MCEGVRNHGRSALFDLYVPDECWWLASAGGRRETYVNNRLRTKCVRDSCLASEFFSIHDTILENGGNEWRLPFISSFGHLWLNKALEVTRCRSTSSFPPSLCSCCFNSGLPLLLFSLNMLHDCNKKQIEHVLFLTGVGHLLSDRSYQNKHTEPSNIHSHTSFLPFPFAVPTIHAHTLLLAAQSESQLTISSYYFEWLGTLPI